LPLSLRLETIYKHLREAFSEWLKDDASLLAAALAYYGLFSFVSLFILILISINSLFQQGLMGRDMAVLVERLAGQQLPSAAGELIDQVGTLADSFPLTLLSILLLSLGAAGLFVQTKKAFHIIWNLSDDDMPFLNMVISYLRSYLLIGLVAFLLLVTSVFTALLIPAALQIEMFLPVHLISLLTFVISFSFVTMLFAATYKTLAGVRLSWSDVLPGSAMAALLFAIGNFCIEAYVKFANIGSPYGAAGSLVVFLVWIYYSAQIFLFGAEWIKVQGRINGIENKVAG
jgi:membrane protein